MCIGWMRRVDRMANQAKAYATITLEDKKKLHVMPGATTGWAGRMLEQYSAMCGL